MRKESFPQGATLTLIGRRLLGIRGTDRIGNVVTPEGISVVDDKNPNKVVLKIEPDFQNGKITTGRVDLLIKHNYGEGKTIVTEVSGIHWKNNTPKPISTGTATNEKPLEGSVGFIVKTDISVTRK